MNDKKVLLSVKDLDVKFRVRGRVLTAIRNISLDIYENESIAIVGESGSGKSVFTKTFAGMLDSNGFIPKGSVILSDDELSVTDVELSGLNKTIYERAYAKLCEFSKLERGAEEYRAIKAKEEEIRHAKTLTVEEEEDFAARYKKTKDESIDLGNYLMTLDKKVDTDEYVKTDGRIKALRAELESIELEKQNLIKQRVASYKNNASLVAANEKALAELKAKREQKISVEEKSGNLCGLSDKKLQRNKVLAYEYVLSIGRFSVKNRLRSVSKLNKAFKNAMSEGADLDDAVVRNKLFEDVGYRVEYRSYDEATNTLHGYAIIDCAKVKNPKDWTKIRGYRIATVFQDPMTSLNPIITIGKQITSVILKHQDCTEVEARNRAVELMHKVGIPNPEKRFDDYPFQYSGGMRQRIVIAIALSCQPKILICDEPTTALDVTIQAQILKLLKDLQKEYNYTIVFITHDLGVVANIADRVAVLYAGQIVELGTVEEVFYDPRQPYTWALLSSLPQLAERDTKLFSINGTPPSLYNKIVGDAFAPRNQYCMKIDTIAEPPMFPVTETHFAKTWLLDPRAPKTEKPELIQNIHEKLVRAMNI